MTSNPMLNTRVTENIVLEGPPMTIQGSINKTLILLSIVTICAYFSWGIFAQGFLDKASLLLMISVICGLILAIVTTFKPNTSNITAPAYAVCEGAALGIISAMYNQAFNGIVTGAIGITLLTLFVMLFLFKSRVIQATPLFKQVIIISTIAIGIFYLIYIIASLFHLPMNIFNGEPLGIAVSAVICVIAALNFILDFDFIERGSENNLPAYYEWYGAFGLLVTLVWLYLEVLRLLAQLSSRRN